MTQRPEPASFAPHSWASRLAGLLGVVVGLGIVLVLREGLDLLDPIVIGWEPHWSISLALLVLAMAVPWLALSPLLSRFGYGWPYIALLTVFPLAALFAGWGVGSGLVRQRGAVEHALDRA